MDWRINFYTSVITLHHVTQLKFCNILLDRLCDVLTQFKLPWDLQLAHLPISMASHQYRFSHSTQSWGQFLTYTAEFPIL